MKNKKLWIALVIIVIGAAVAIHFYKRSAGPAEQSSQGAQSGRRGGGNGMGGPMPVMAAIAHKGDIDVVINALGTVTALNTATVKARVNGQLQRINFKDGQLVKAGDVLAQIDPRPYQVTLDQANGQLLHDEALLASAKINYERYAGLLAKDSIAKQQVDDQKSLVQQYEGTVANDRGQVASAKLQLDFTRITAPISGRLGLRQIDVGNMVQTTDTNGLVVITQTQPLYVIFSIPADKLADIYARLDAKQALTVTALDRDGKSKLSTGKLLTVDNQIDATTGTVKLKAEFANGDNKLFPNQFVNAQLRVETRHDATLIPMAAIQRGTPGTFVYVVGAERAVSIRPVALGPINDENVSIEKGLAVGEQVVTDGADKLREGAKVEITRPADRQKAANERDGHHKQRQSQSTQRQPQTNPGAPPQP